MCQIRIVKGTGFPCAAKSYAIIFRQVEVKSGFEEHETQILKDIRYNLCALVILVYVCLWHREGVKRRGTRKQN